MSVVSNTTPIISLSAIGHLSLLPKLFGKVIIPEAVYHEIQSKKAPGHKEIDAQDFQVVKIKGKEYLGFLLTELDAGEAEAIILAKEIRADALIIDERAGYKISIAQKINAIGTLTVLLAAKRMGFIDSVKPLLDEMIRKGRWYSDFVYQNFLQKIGEL